MRTLRDLNLVVPGLGDARVIEEFAGGSVNRSWRLLSADGGTTAVLRRDTVLAADLNLDRAREVAVLKEIRERGVGPELLYAAPEQGILVTRHVPGRVLTEHDLRDPRWLRQVGQLLATVHEVPSAVAPVDYAALAAAYAAQLDSADATTLASEARRLARQWCSDESHFRLCHHDPVHSNFISPEDSGRLLLLDWEYAGRGEPWMDIAAVAEHHGLPQAATRALLESYGGDCDPERFGACRSLYRRLAVLWLMAVCVRGPAPAAYVRALSRLRKRLKGNS